MREDFNTVLGAMRKQREALVSHLEARLAQHTREMETSLQETMKTVHSTLQSFATSMVSLFNDEFLSHEVMMKEHHERVMGHIIDIHTSLDARTTEIERRLDALEKRQDEPPNEVA